MPARLDASSRESSPCESPSFEALSESMGIDCATSRKKSSMYWRDTGSYCAWVSIRQDFMRREMAYVDLHRIIVGATHMAFWEQTIGEKRQQYKLGESEQLVSG